MIDHVFFFFLGLWGSVVVNCYIVALSFSVQFVGLYFFVLLFVCYKILSKNLCITLYDVICIHCTLIGKAFFLNDEFRTN